MREVFGLNAAGAHESFDGYLEARSQQGSDTGFEPVFMPDQAMDFQSAMIEWSVRKGRAAIFEDCGMGKTLQALSWARNVYEYTGKPVLILTPLAVASQTVTEGEKFGIEVVRGDKGPIRVTNYHRLGMFSPQDFGGVVCDESSILKNFDGSLKSQITEFMRRVPYRLLCTATAAPNDYTELGTSSEALGYMGHMDMLGRFFRNDQNNVATKRMYGEVAKWRFKGHAERPFWRWVCSWARALRKPSDLGFDDGPLALPPITVNRRLVESTFRADGMLFDLPAVTLPEQRQEQRETISERCEMAASLVDHSDPAIVWCHLDAEGAELRKLIPGSVEVSGKQSDDEKESAFERFLSGDARVLITKPKIGAWGLNFQHCAHVVYFPSHSFEQYYQAVRRCWRFGQERPVTVDVIYTTGQERVLENLERKARQAEDMFGRLVDEMNNALSVEQRVHDNTVEVPSWIQ